MGFRFSKPLKIAPGINVNLSKSGIGLSAGVPGFRVSTGPRGRRATASIPGSGFSYSVQATKTEAAKPRSRSADHYPSLRFVIPLTIVAGLCYLGGNVPVAVFAGLFAACLCLNVIQDRCNAVRRGEL